MLLNFPRLVTLWADSTGHCHFLDKTYYGKDPLGWENGRRWMKKKEEGREEEAGEGGRGKRAASLVRITPCCLFFF